MGSPIDKITLKGFKSIRNLEDFPLRNLNILIGANGAGKSNFVSFFTFLREVVAGRLGLYVEKKGGADDHLFLGPKITESIHTHLRLRTTGHEMHLQRTVRNEFVFAEERIQREPSGASSQAISLGKGHKESKLADPYQRDEHQDIARSIRSSLSGSVAYHFHDTSDNAPMRRPCSVRDTDYLRSEAANLASFLRVLHLEHPDTYVRIKETVRLAAPFFDDFTFRPRVSNGDEVLPLEWTQKGSDYPFLVNQLSDGTLRFIALATALLQPNPPATMLFDEPELGLHPYALNLFAALVKKAASKTQIIVSTQSAPLLDNFEAEDIIVVERKEGESTFKRLSSAELAEWLKDYSLGELWQKNVLGGRPTDG